MIHIFTLSTLLSVYTWLHSIPQHQHHSQIRGWYDCGGADHQKRWLSGAQRTHSTPKNNNKRTHYGPQEEDGCPLTTEHQRGEGGESGQLQIPGHTHLWGPHMDGKHHSACWEGTTATVLSKTKEGKPVTTACAVPPVQHTSRVICNNLLSQMHFTAMEHVFCISWETGIIYCIFF